MCPTSMLMKKGNLGIQINMHRGEIYANMKADVQVIHLQTKEC
jgi:hypothetical protein